MRIHRHHFPILKARRFHGYGFAPRMLIFIAAIVVVIGICSIRLRPVVQEYAYNQAVHIASSAVNSAVSDVLSDNALEYDDLILLLTDTSGNVTALQANTLKINRLRSEIIDSVMAELDDLGSTHIKIPLFSGVSPSLISKLCPKISVVIEPMGTAYASFGSEFYDAGINQTVHRITMNVRADITVLLPNSNVTAGLNTDVCIAETVIVGSVPESYSMK